jgi:hypothetical protein
MEAIMAIARFNTLCAAAVAATMIAVSPALRPFRRARPSPAGRLS